MIKRILFIEEFEIVVGSKMEEKNNSVFEYLNIFITVKKFRLSFLIICVFCFSANAQQAKTDSLLKKNSLGLEMIYFGNEVQSLTNGFFSTPQIQISYEHALCKKLYLNAGYVYNYFETANSNNQLFKSSPLNMLLSAGVDYKLKIFPRFFFTPSLDFYFSHTKVEGKSSPFIVFENSKKYSVGADLNFEFYPCKRISVDASLMAMTYGIKYPLYKTDGGYLFSNNGWFQVPKVLSLGINYNF
ncbi:hypothetical protein LBMAG27_19760 [Bacteroidota bacterium]|nr:hypothetical protein LBMAG27_19760 [Bacteroidota bacterium]